MPESDAAILRARSRRAVSAGPFSGIKIVPESVPQIAKRSRSPVLILAFFAASAVLHAAVLLALPDFSLDRSPPQVTVLEVVLVQTGPSVRPPSPDTRAVAPAPREATLGTRVPGAKPAERPRPVTRRPAPTVLTLPDIAPPENVMDSAQSQDKAPSPVPEPAPQVASVAPPTSPSFSATYLRNPAPRYPVAARRAGEQGTVTLKVLVASDGLPRRVEIEKTSGSTRLDTAALDAVRQWRFVPARRGSTPIESWVLVPVVFRLENPS